MPISKEELAKAAVREAAHEFRQAVKRCSSYGISVHWRSQDDDQELVPTFIDPDTNKNGGKSNPSVSDTY